MVHFYKHKNAIPGMRCSAIKSTDSGSGRIQFAIDGSLNLNAFNLKNENEM